jgi:hypothetical protein
MVYFGIFLSPWKEATTRRSGDAGIRGLHRQERLTLRGDVVHDELELPFG